MFDTFRLDTSLPPDAALERIRHRVRAPGSVWLAPVRNVDLPFVGEVSGNAFEFRCDVSYRNSFLPEISGRVTETKGGSPIEAEMWIHPPSLIFMTVWICAGWIAIAGAVVKGSVGIALGLVGVVAAGVGFVALGLVPEVRIARRMLTNAFDTPESASRVE